MNGLKVSINHIDEYIAEEFGKVARGFHVISSLYKSSILPKKSHLDGFTQFINDIRNQVKLVKTNMSVEALKMVEDYLQLTENHIKNEVTTKFDFIIQSDLNPLNIIWNEDKKVIGIVDSESIGYSDRLISIYPLPI